MQHEPVTIDPAEGLDIPPPRVLDPGRRRAAAKPEIIGTGVSFGGCSREQADELRWGAA